MRFFLLPLLAVTTTHGWMTTPLRVARSAALVRPKMVSVNYEQVEEPVASFSFPQNDTTFVAAATLEQVPAIEMPPMMVEAPASISWETRRVLVNPVSWVCPTFAVLCGAAASGNFGGVQDFMLVLAAMAMAGPFWEGFAQTLDAWVAGDRKTSGRKKIELSSKDYMTQLGVLLAGGMGLSLGLDAAAVSPVIAEVSLLCFFLNFLYIAPPASLQNKGWMGDMAARLPNVALPWICGQAMLGGMNQPQDFLIPVVCSMAQLGPAILNDLVVPQKKKRGAPTVNNGPKWVVIGVQDGIQLAMAAYLASIGENLGAAALAALVIPQMFTQRSLLFSNLLDNDTKAFLFSQPFIYMGYLVTALSLGHSHSVPM